MKHPVLICILLSAALLLVLANEEGEPMRDEDVVRLFVSGTPASRLVERIRASSVDFDLSDEMLGELRVAGLPDAVIQAMIDRQAELAPPEPDGQQHAAAERRAPTLTIRLNPDWKPRKPKEPTEGQEPERPVLRLPEPIPPQVVSALQIRGSDAKFTDIAVYLICRTTDHVPDHWRAKTPLGRDFSSAPRHRMLEFLPGARRVEAGKPGRKFGAVPGYREAADAAGVLEYEISAQIEVELEPGVAHDLSLGIAVQAADRYYRLIDDGWDGLVLDDGNMQTTARIRQNKERGAEPFQVRFTDKP